MIVIIGTKYDCNLEQGLNMIDAILIEAILSDFR